MGPPRQSASRSLFPHEPGLRPAKGYPSSGGVFDPFPFQEFEAPIDRLQRVERRRKFAPVTFTPKNRIRLAIKHPPWVLGLAQIVVGKPENAVASASPSSALRLPHSRHRTSTGSEWSGSVLEPPLLPRQHVVRRFLLASVPVSQPFLACDRGQVALPDWIAAPNRREPSEDDLAAIPNVSHIHPGLSRVGC
jgi:hypothetical protein